LRVVTALVTNASILSTDQPSQSMGRSPPSISQANQRIDRLHRSAPPPPWHPSFYDRGPTCGYAEKESTATYDTPRPGSSYRNQHEPAPKNISIVPA